MDIGQIEDTLISTIEGLGLFRVVSSLGRKGRPTALNYPSAFVYFVSDRDIRTGPRPMMEITYEVLVVDKNARSESKAAKDVYALIDAVRDAINGKTLGIPDIEPWVCSAREIVEYDAGTITYALRFQTRHYLPVP